ncbi:hypothetical protein IGI39_004220 [Enterococcus sp. AZ135]|uniref:hypothetical protein n=1 Tax=unclassified Enterococcus TaxID=2608891 RepID=UPI003F1F340E
MEKRSLQIPFYCVNTKVLWKDEEAIKNALLVDKKIAELGLDAIFTSSAEDVVSVKKVTSKIRIGIVYDPVFLEKLEMIRREGAEVLIFDEIEACDNSDTILQRIKELGFLILVRTRNPLDIPKSVLEMVDIIKWTFLEEIPFDNHEDEKKQLEQFKAKNQDIAIIYGANTISSNIVLNSLIMGVDGVGEEDCGRNTYEKRKEMLQVVNDYKNVQVFLNS